MKTLVKTNVAGKRVRLLREYWRAKSCHNYSNANGA
jgi:hypothetical protein